MSKPTKSLPNHYFFSWFMFNNMLNKILLKFVYKWSMPKPSKSLPTLKCFSWFMFNKMVFLVHAGLRPENLISTHFLNVFFCKNAKKFRIMEISPTYYLFYRPNANGHGCFLDSTLIMLRQYDWQ